MTVKGKASGAALTLLAPEAKAAGAAAGATSAAGGDLGAGVGMLPGSRKRPKAGPSKASRQRAQIQAIKDARPAEPPATDDDAPASPKGPGLLTDQTGSPDWYRKATNPDPVRAANAGGGFVLGVMAWVVVRAYLEGGSIGVKNLLKAKFLNKVGGS